MGVEALLRVRGTVAQTNSVCVSEGESGRGGQLRLNSVSADVQLLPAARCSYQPQRSSYISTPQTHSPTPQHNPNAIQPSSISSLHSHPLASHSMRYSTHATRCLPP